MPTLRRIVVSHTCRPPPPPPPPPPQPSSGSSSSSTSSADNSTPSQPQNGLAVLAATASHGTSSPPSPRPAEADAHADAEVEAAPASEQKAKDDTCTKAKPLKQKKTLPAKATVQERIQIAVKEAEKKNTNPLGFPLADLEKSSQMECTLLSDPPRDEENLSPAMVFIRRHIEWFAATEQDAKDRFVKGGKSQIIVPGIIGIRCIHCRHLRLLERPSGSTAFPSRTNAVYQGARNWIRYHLNVCPFIPDEVKSQYKSYKRTQGLTGTEKFWTDSARRKGLYDGYSDECGGVPGIFYGTAKGMGLPGTASTFGKRKLAAEDNIGDVGEDSRSVDLEPSDKKKRKAMHDLNPGRKKSPDVSEPNRAVKAIPFVRQLPSTKQLQPLHRQSMQKESSTKRQQPMKRKLPPSRKIPMRKQFQMDQDQPVLEPTSAERDTVQEQQVRTKKPTSAKEIENSVAAAAAVAPPGSLSRAGQETNSSNQQPNQHDQQVGAAPIAPLTDARMISSLPTNVLLELLAQSNVPDMREPSGILSQRNSQQAFLSSISSLFQNMPTEMLYRVASGSMVTATAANAATSTAATAAAEPEARSQATVEAPGPAKKSVAEDNMQPIPTFPTGKLHERLDSPDGLASQDDKACDEDKPPKDKHSGSRENPTVETDPAERIRQIDNEIVKLLRERERLLAESHNKQSS